jgi:glucokinase
MIDAAIPVLEVGGTHVSTALVDPKDWTVRPDSHHRHDIDAAAPAEVLVATLIDAADSLNAPAAATWGIAMPDPFDYEHGIALFEGVGKFDRLQGRDLGHDLRAGISPRPTTVRFVNDADAFILGEWVNGAARGTARCAGLTLGTGVGSGWLIDGAIVDTGPDVPPGGRAHRIRLDDQPLEDIVSRRAIVAAFQRGGGDPTADVREIADAARAGSDLAITTLTAAMRALGRAIGPYLERFRPDVLIIGGSMSASWTLFADWFTAGCAEAGTDPPPIRIAEHPEDAPLIGAAWHTTRAVSPSRSESADGPTGSATA